MQKRKYAKRIGPRVPNKIRLHPTLSGWLRSEAKRQGVTVNSLIEDALSQLMPQSKQAYQ